MKRFLLLAIAALMSAITGLWAQNTTQNTAQSAQSAAQSTPGVDDRSPIPYMLRDNGRVRLLDRPSKDGREVLTLITYRNNGKWYRQALLPEGSVPPDMGRLGPDPDCAVIGSTEGEWIKLRVAVELTGMESADQTNTLYGYVDRQTLEANMEPVSERASGAILREKLGEKIDDAVNLDRRFPVWVAVLLVLNLVVAGMPDKRAGLRLALGYITLVAAFALELLYIALLEEKFWWCEPDQVGWLKAILFFIVTLVLAVYQFFSFFNLLNQINERSRPFNTYVGITLFTLVTVVMFVYAIFTGGLNDRQNLILIYILVGTQALQMLISAVQLRRHPLYALMVLLLIPLGTFAVLLSFLRLFAILCFLALLGLVFFSMASGRGAPLSAGKKEEDPAKTFTQAGPNMIRDGNGVEYRKVPYDYSSTHPGEKVEHFGGDKYVRK